MFKTIIEKILLAVFVACFAVVTIYVPQPQKATAAGAADMSTLSGQLTALVEQGFTAVYSGKSSFSNAITAVNSGYDWVKESSLDGIAWALAKSAIARMTSSIVSWINSGFEGSPRFVTDLSGFLRETADSLIGEYLEELGGVFSFVCAPFKLDVRIALAASYQQVRDGEFTASSCTLTGALENITSFMDGTMNMTDSGGWDAWFSITANPTQYTGFGTMLAVKDQAQARLVNARGEDLFNVGTGDGFLSTKVCEKAEGAGDEKKQCTVTTPGKVISEALNFQLSTPQRSLLEAREINEIIGALFGQLTEKAITGAAGLLGLSGGTGYTYSGGPNFTDQLAGEDSSPYNNPELFAQTLAESVLIESSFLDLLDEYQPLLLTYTIMPPPRTPAGKIQMVQDAYDEMVFGIRGRPSRYDQVNTNRIFLDNLISDLQDRVTNPPPLPAPQPTPSQINVAFQDIVQRFIGNRDLHTEDFILGEEIRYEGLLR